MKGKRLTHLAVVGTAVAAVAAPVASASNHYIQIDGQLVAPAQLSAAQLAAGHSPSTRLVQIAGSFVEPSQVSRFQSGGGLSAAAADGSSLDTDTVGIVAGAVAGALLLMASGTLIVRRRHDRVAAEFSRAT